ncbi:MAG: ABC transporter ATP-binding protein [Cyclobacteriaceae bacterium]
MDSSAIEISGLTKKYGDYIAVDSLNLNIKKGEVFGLLGPNGAGKSTTMLMLMGLSEPNDGTVSVCGINPTREPIDVKRKVGYLPEDVGFYEDMTGLENLMFTARLNSLSENEAREKSLSLLERVGLSAEVNKKAGKYSRGMRQRLGLADVLIKNPEVIILDEPTLGIDPSGVKAFLDLIIELSKEEGITVLFSSHLLHQVQQVCDRVGIFVKGKLLAHGNVNGLAEQLFETSAFTINAEIDRISDQKANKLKKLLTEIPEVVNISQNENRYAIECKSDISATVAKTIIDAGIGLSSLSKKEYGLDDIYHRYFEGAEEKS